MARGRAILLLALLLPATGMSGMVCNGGTSNVLPTIVANDHILGDVNAPLTIVEYASFRCSWCRQFVSTQFASLRQRYIDTHQVRWVFRTLLSLNDADAVRAAGAAECAADQSRYLAYRDLLFQGAVALDAETLRQHAITLGLDLAAFDACLGGDSKMARIQQDLDSGVELGVSHTPTFFVGSEKVAGYQTAEQLGAIIDRHLNSGF